MSTACTERVACSARAVDSLFRSRCASSRRSSCRVQIAKPAAVRVKSTSRALIQTGRRLDGKAWAAPTGSASRSPYVFPAENEDVMLAG